MEGLEQLDPLLLEGTSWSISGLGEYLAESSEHQQALPMLSGSVGETQWEVVGFLLPMDQSENSADVEEKKVLEGTHSAGDTAASLEAHSMKEEKYSAPTAPEVTADSTGRVSACHASHMTEVSSEVPLGEDLTDNATSVSSNDYYTGSEGSQMDGENSNSTYVDNCETEKDGPEWKFVSDADSYSGLWDSETESSCSLGESIARMTCARLNPQQLDEIERGSSITVNTFPEERRLSQCEKPQSQSTSSSKFLSPSNSTGHSGPSMLSSSLSCSKSAGYDASSSSSSSSLSKCLRSSKSSNQNASSSRSLSISEYRGHNVSSSKSPHSTKFDNPSDYKKSKKCNRSFYEKCEAKGNNTATESGLLNASNKNTLGERTNDSTCQSEYSPTKSVNLNSRERFSSSKNSSPNKTKNKLVSVSECAQSEKSHNTASDESFPVELSESNDKSDLPYPSTTSSFDGDNDPAFPEETSQAEGSNNSGSKESYPGKTTNDSNISHQNIPSTSSINSNNSIFKSNSHPSSGKDCDHPANHSNCRQSRKSTVSARKLPSAIKPRELKTRKDLPGESTMSCKLNESKKPYSSHKDASAKDKNKSQSESKVYTCNVCGKGFVDKRYLLNHSRRHTKVNSYKCDACGGTFATELEFEKHCLTHKESPCGRKFSSKKKLTKDDTGRSLDKRLSCNVSDKEFTTSEDLGINNQKHTSTKSYKCHFCPSKFKRSRDLLRHTRRHTGDTRFQCKICGISFKNKQSFSRHDHTGKKPYMCSKCGRRFARKYDLEMHMLIHTGERPHQCDLCGRTFKANTDLNRHYKIHNKRRRFKCTECGVLFVQEANLREHKKIHTGEKPFQCNVCELRFTRKSNLKRHKMIHSGEAFHEHKCTTCGKFFRDNSELLRHAGTHREERRHTCDFCGETFQQLSNLHTHVRKHILKKKMLEKSTKPQARKRWTFGEFCQRSNLGGKVRSLACDICCKKFYRVHGLNRHRDWHITEGNYSCDTCRWVPLVDGEAQPSRKLCAKLKPDVRLRRLSEQ